MMNRDLSIALNTGGAGLLGGVIGAAIGLLVGGPYSSIIAAIATAVVITILTWSGSVVFLDEYDCIWWWISIAYVTWLRNNALRLSLIYLISPALATGLALAAFLDLGYLRVGSATFYDAMGIGNPGIPAEPV
ncbi:MAG: hypothetical protein QXU42_06000 [Thermoproteota archaeon]